MSAAHTTITSSIGHALGSKGNTTTATFELISAANRLIRLLTIYFCLMNLSSANVLLYGDTPMPKWHLKITMTINPIRKRL